jgi:hypothetical protein
LQEIKMALGILATQTEEYWREEYQVSTQDLDMVTGIILEAGKPQPITALAAEIIRRQYQAEKAQAAQRAGKGAIYRPADTYEVGEKVLFTALDFHAGTVAAVRPGKNPKYGPFQVIQVAFEGGGGREFAAGLDIVHPLNIPVEQLMAGGDAELDEHDVVRLFTHDVATKLEAALAKQEDYALFGGLWFLNALLPEVHIGYLNLAEAMVYEAHKPLAAQDILPDLGMEPSGSEDAQLFALNRALRNDARFDDVSMRGEPVWYLRALEPAEVFERPAVLAPAFSAEGGEQIGITMLDVVDQLGDDLDDIETMIIRPAAEVRCEMIFPYLHAGALPLTDQFLRLLPSGAKGHFPITFVDAASDHRFGAWVLPEERYVCGLGDWFAALGMCVGGQIAIAAANEPLTFTLSATALRTRGSDWVRSATVEDGELRLQMQRLSVAVRADKNMLIDVPDRAAMAGLMAQMEARKVALPRLVHVAFSELAKLGSRGLVHIKALYAAVNLMRRVGSVPVFAYLTRQACYDPVGDGFWAYDASLEGKAYATSDEMRERPLSTRGDLVRDQVVQYLGR